MDDTDNSSALEALEKDYQATLKEIAGPKAQIVEPFRVEYEKLYKALLRSHESEKRLTKKIRDLNAEIGASGQTVQTAMKNAAEDQQTIANLRREIETQQKLVQQSLEKERLAKDAIAKFKGEIAELQQRIDQGAGMSAEQELQLTQLASQREQLEKDRDMLKNNTDMLQKIVVTRHEEVHSAEEARLRSEDKIAEVKNKVADKRKEVDAEKHRKEQLEQQMKDLRFENQMRQEEFNTIYRGIQAEEAELRKVQDDINSADKQDEAVEKRVRAKRDEKIKLEDKLKTEVERNHKHVQENQNKELQVRAKKDDIANLEQQCQKVQKMHEVLQSKDRNLDEERRKLEVQRNELKEELKFIQTKVDEAKANGDGDRKKIEDLLRERDILNKSVVKADERTKKQIDVVKRQETQCMNLQKDIARWKSDLQDFRKRIHELERQREKYGAELQQAQTKHAAAKEDLKTRVGVLTDLKKQIAAVEAKLTTQKNLYEAVQMDRNGHSKSYEDFKDQIADMRRKFKNMFFQNTALKEEIREKDNRVVKSHFNYESVLKLNEKLRDSKEKAKRRMNNLMDIVETQRTQMKKLESTIQEAENERQAQQKELEGVIGERDILGAQLIRRNEELALLYEKIKIQQSTLQKGESQYQDRIVEVNKLRADIRKAKADVETAKTQVTNVDSLKREIHHLTKTLLREETKAKALQEELDNPMNVHRWRELEGSDPATYEMIQKVKSLQKLLIAKTEEVVEKDSLIQEKEKLYVQLKSIIARQPGPEVAEQLSWYSQNLKDKTASMKQMKQELEMYHTQVQDLRDEINRHNKDFADIKQQYFQRLRQQQKQATYEAGIAQATAAVMAAPPRNDQTFMP